ncbi:MAG: MFS transporter [Fibrobacteres bacterium]|nr:MFS transporter [Fibrobacterota bacterium]
MDKPILPETGPITEIAILKVARLKIAAAACFGYLQNALGQNLITVIVKVFGGKDFHLGLVSAIASMGQVLQFAGSLILQKIASNKKGYLTGGAISIIALLFSAFFVFHAHSSWSNGAFTGYILMVFLLALGGAICGNIAVSWIGDLVPKDKLGWFFSLKWIAINVVTIIGGLSLAKIADVYPTPKGYALILILGTAASIIAMLIFLTVPDRTPKTTSFFGSGKNGKDRLNYGNSVLWCYVAFYVIWAGGRTLLNTFAPVYLIDKFHFKLTDLAWLNTLCLTVSIIVIYIIGNLSGKKGSRILLLLMSGGVGVLMYLWVLSAYFGIVPIIIYYILSGAAGQTHSMLAINYGIEIFPDKGRSAYLAFARFFIGGISIIAPFLAGYVMTIFHNVQYQIGGATIDRYHLCFLAGATITVFCTVPLFIAGNRTVQPLNNDAIQQN